MQVVHVAGQHIVAQKLRCQIGETLMSPQLAAKSDHVRHFRAGQTRHDEGVEPGFQQRALNDLMAAGDPVCPERRVVKRIGQNHDSPLRRQYPVAQIPVLDEAGFVIRIDRQPDQAMNRVTDDRVGRSIIVAAEVLGRQRLVDCGSQRAGILGVPGIGRHEMQQPWWARVIRRHQSLTAQFVGPGIDRDGRPGLVVRRS